MAERRRFPDISDIIARKEKGREEQARLSFGEKLVILEKMRERVAPIVRARELRRGSSAAVPAGKPPRQR